MPRRRAAEKREVLPDAKYGDVVLAKFINCLMLQGKKSVAEKIVYGALDTIGQRTGQEPVRVFHEALDNVKPTVEVRIDRRQALAIRWIIETVRKRSENTMAGRLSNELMDAAQNRGTAVKKREDTHRMAEANKAFSHYRW